MGVNLTAGVDGFEIWEEDFHRRGPGAPAGATLDGSVEDGCIQEGRHKVLRFNLYCINVGDKDLVIGNPRDRPDMFEPSAVHRQSGYIMKDKFNVYTLKNGRDIELKGHKRPFCLIGGAPFTCRNQGIRANGGEDQYSNDLACQFIVIDGIPDGEYTFEAVTNATSVQAAKEKVGKIVFEEDDYDDNTVTIRLRINGRRVQRI
jgi:Lysyl oxidase